MDNRYATLPLWSGGRSEQQWSFAAQAAWSDIRSGSLELSGPMLSFGLHRSLNSQWSLGAFAFYDDLSFGTGTGARPLQTLFSPTTPIERPVDAVFASLGGSTVDAGFGLYASRAASTTWLGEHRWVAGLIWQRVRLQDYRFDYRIEAGPSQGVTGQIDFDATYEHLTPFVGFEWPRARSQWIVSPHVLLAVPMPRRGFVGHITGPGFDLHGDTQDVGAGKHFGDPSLTLGLDLTYQPWHLTIDLGATLTQWLLEPQVHHGIEQNWLISAQWRY